MDSVEKTSGILDIEYQKLASLVEKANSASQLLPLEKIIETYYQAMSVTSLIFTIKKQLEDEGENTPIQEKTSEIERFVSDKFNSGLHPMFMKNLSSLIEKTTADLKSKDPSSQKSKEEIENEAKMYEQLRQTMSTKEFVEQYDKGLPHD